MNAPAGLNSLASVDPVVAGWIHREEQRQRGTLEMIASENFTSTAVMEAVQDVDLRVMEKFGLPGVANDRTEWLKPLAVFRSMRPNLSVDSLGRSGLCQVR